MKLNDVIAIIDEHKIGELISVKKLKQELSKFGKTEEKRINLRFNEAKKKFLQKHKKEFKKIMNNLKK